MDNRSPENIGEKEVHGAQHNSLLLQFLNDIRRGEIKDDQVPCCTVFTGAVLERSGIPAIRFELAKSYLI